MKYAIETFDLTKKYGDFRAVDELNMKIPNKSIFGFLGPNGAGKTTTIKMLTCLISPTSGTANVAGYDVKKKPNEVRTKIGMVPQLVSLYGDLTARENAELCADFYGMPRDLKEKRIDELMELVDIKYAADKQVSQMSGGQKQKVSVVASLVHQPDILFLDEPTIGLDPTTKRVLWDLISELNEKGHTIILCSHDMYEVELLCDNVGIINQGVLAAYDTPQGLKDTMIKQEESEKKAKIGTIIDKIGQENPVGKENTFNDLKTAVAELERQEDSSKQMSIMVSNLDENLVTEITKLPVVFEITQHHSGRIIMQMDENCKTAVNDVIWTIMQNNGNITSISTKDPSLEDVFMKVTAKEKNKTEEE
ncbi:ATP-binding cassette domain-containing protein [Methanobacterium alcaliphilum]|uniref:ATP-binding cassette domain-containing protein n=1 Tax=Methanobacterium alcaliphilum TaxID=392018 RepID=UPI00200A963F|nr:ATP-binding cassette domain-containing protein [Methanobacterium alcaliphilum]MCK9152361.1 ATP-binding cassette domain-containing protein [Methanobacterium alcaliphilum]